MAALSDLDGRLPGSPDSRLVHGEAEARDNAEVAPQYEYPVAVSRMKRNFDLIVGSALAVGTLPIMIAILAFVFIESGWPVLFRQERIGYKGRPFRIWKVRTMIHDAESLRPSLMASNEAPFPAFKLRNDPRVTRVGRLLRRSGLDELPQLANVITGEMSLVGPRPPLPREAAHYDSVALRRLDAKPGMTCIWQTRGRQKQNVSFDEWIEMDVEYIRRWSLWLDIQLLLRTTGAVIRMTGS